MAVYRFGNLLNSGGFGDVFEITCDDDGWVGVAKRLRAPYSDEDFARFQREVRLMTQLDHANIVSIRASNLTDEQPWYAMERASNNLRDELLAQGAGEHLIPRFVEICRAVAHAHHNGIVHRDLKPENVLVFHEPLFGEYCVVTDFGLGKHLDQSTLSLTMTNAQMGTLAYMAPEQHVDAKNVDETVDVYALGKILYELLTGELPMYMIPSRLDPKFRHIVSRATEVDPRARYQGVDELLSAVEIAKGGPDNFMQPEELAAELIGRLQERPTKEDLKKLAHLIVARSADETFLYRALPTLPAPVIGLLLEYHRHEFVHALEAYDALVSGSLSFSYCDTVADFYGRVFSVSVDTDLQLLVLRRLPDLGYSHSRWHVGEVFGRILATVTDQGLLMAVRELFVADPSMASWISPYLRNVPPLLQDVIVSSELPDF